MMRAFAASCFALACLPCVARADDDPSPPLPSLPAPSEPSPPPPQASPALPEDAATPDARAAPATDVPADDAPKVHHLVWSLEGGYTHHVLFGVPINSGDVSLIIGGNFRQFSISGIIDATGGSTVDGLSTYTATYGPLIEAHFGAVRLGAGARFGVDGMASLSMGAMARVTVDLLDLAPSDGVFLVGKATADLLGTSPFSALYGATLGVGVRFLRF
jgi:hypothetical protein